MLCPIPTLLTLQGGDMIATCFRTLARLHGCTLGVNAFMDASMNETPACHMYFFLSSLLGPTQNYPCEVDPSVQVSCTAAFVHILFGNVEKAMEMWKSW